MNDTLDKARKAWDVIGDDSAVRNPGTRCRSKGPTEAIDQRILAQAQQNNGRLARMPTAAPGTSRQARDGRYRITATAARP